ncbi:MAG TPA: extracellular solute-binding protein [Chloroflexota bacterium]|nr:extracellular solute-binding protein [Chloroflexota bacterium]
MKPTGNAGGVSRRTVLAASAVPAMLGAACRTPATQTPPAAKPGTGKVVVLSYQSTSPRLDLQIAMYEALNRDLQPAGLEVEFVPTTAADTDVMTKATTFHAAGTPADLFEWPRLWREIESIIGEVTPYFKRDKLDEKQWIPDSIEAMKDSEGKLWGLPVTISADAMAYNLDLFEAAGLKPPPQDPDDRSWTMELFLDYARRLTRGNEQFGMESKCTGGVDWMNWPTWFGYGPVDYRNKRVTINTSGFQRGLQYWIDLQLRHQVWPTADQLNALRATANQDSFLTGKVAMKGIFNLATKPDFRWGIAAMPYTPSPGEPRNVSARISVHALFMDSTARNKDGAWEVFKYWMRPETNARYVLSNGHIVSPLLNTRSELTLADFQQKMGADPKAFLLQAQRSRVDGWRYYLLKDQGKARTEIDKHFTEAKAGKMPVPEFTQRAQELTEQLTSF